LQEEKHELQATIKEIEGGAGVGSAGSAIDVSGLKRQVSRIDHTIEERTPEKVRGSDKDRMVKEEAAIEESLAAGMPTRDEMRYPTRNPGAVRKHMEWCRRNENNISRYVAIQRQLRPNDPKSIEVLRREK
jgi:hypothetical protein